MSAAGGGNIKVVVRCRPLNAREIARGAKSLVRMEGNNTFLDPPEAANVTSGRVTEKETKSFAFDRSYWSACPKDDPSYASQQTLYDDLGRDLLDHAFEGFNCCIFAYGQTGSGKSYSMMGYGADRGIIPLICEALFERIRVKTQDSDGKVSFNVEVSYTEIYQEKVRDLLNPLNKGNLKVREHPTLGPYVENLSKCAVQAFEDIEHLMDEGTKARTVAATQMNETSSRSHAVFTLLLTQKRHDPETNMTGERVSRISLVDLAGSERANSTGATGQTLKEGANINKSLTTLGRVIAALAQASAAKGGKAQKLAQDKVPYRDSVLTWLLKDSLGGNSKTAMIAAISPADYEETLSTLRYANQAKKIKNMAVVNEDPNAKLIRELKEELQTLRARMGISGPVSSASAVESTFDPSVSPEKQVVQYRSATGELKTITKAELQDQLEASEKLMASVTETWEQKLQKTKEVEKEREKALESLGITIEKNHVGVHAPKKMPHLVNLSEDPLMSECLVYQIKPGRTTVGNMDSEAPADIKLSGTNIFDDHCFFDNASDGKVTLYAGPKGIVMVNGLRISPSKPKELRSGYRIILGDFHVFRFNHPEEVRKAREGKVRQELRSPLIDSYDDSGVSSPATRPDSPMSNVDWAFARREAVVARLNGKDLNLDQMNDNDLNRLYSSILRVKHSRTASSVAGSDRPESRMSFLNSVTEDGDDEDEDGSDFRSRPYSGSTWTTDPTSLADSTLTLHHLPDLEEKGFGLDDAPLPTPLASTAQLPAIVLAEAEKKKRSMEEKVKKLEAQMAAQRKRIAKLRSNGSAATNGLRGDELDDLYDEWPRMTPEQEALARKVVDTWCRQRRIRMAEDALSHAVVLKEANVLSRELKKGVAYQLIILERNVLLSSASECIAGLEDIDDVVDPTLASCPKPCVAVKVLDRRHQILSIWSLAKLEQRLQQMRSQYKWLDKPEYRQHFASQDPFYESPSPPGGYSLVGTALASLAPLSRGLPSTQTLQVYSPYIADPIGSCRLRLTPLLNDQSNGHTDDASTDPRPLSVHVEVDEVVGFDKTEFATLHLQVSTATLFGTAVEHDASFVSEPIDLDQQDLVNLRLARTFDLDLTPDFQRFLHELHAQIFLFGRARPPHFDRIERWDEAREAASILKARDALAVRGDPANDDVTRRPEKDYVNEQQHDILAHIQIRELGERGEYEPVQVISTNSLDAGAFFLRQGIQRRFVLDLSSNSGRAFSWKRVFRVSLGNVRLLDGQGRVHAATSAADAELRGMGHPQPVFSSDGTSILSFAAAWDSSVHDSPHLNRTTPQGSRALVRLSFDIEVSGCSSPIAFSTDFAVTIAGRDARPPSKLLSLFNSNRQASRIAAVFAVNLRPYKTRKASDVWRLDTSDIFVRGEELLAGWRPRGLTLIRDYDSVAPAKSLVADVEGTKAIVAALDAALPTVEDGRPADRLRTVLALWQKQFGPRGEIPLERERGDNKMLDLASPAPPPSLCASAPSSPKLTGSASRIPRAEAANKRGPLAILRDPTSNQWRKHWFVLRRPYLYLYNSSAEIDVVAVINVSTVRVEQSPEIERMLERKFAFAIFTHQNSYFFAAPSLRDMISWMKAIDPSLAA